MRIYGGLRKGIGMETYRHGPTYTAENSKLPLRIRDLDLSERRRRYTSSRDEEEVDAQDCPRGKAIGSRTHLMTEYQLYKEERVVLRGEMRDVNECDMELFDALDSEEKAMIILGNKWWSQTAKQDKQGPIT